MKTKNSVRKVLRDVTNNNGGRTRLKLKTIEKEGTPRVQEQDDALDSLLGVQSDLSALIQQIDELVVQAFKLKERGGNGRKEIGSFSHALSETLFTLKPWVRRFQNILEAENQHGGPSVSKETSDPTELKNSFDESPEQTKLESLISPSPLVSWRADSIVERGRQLFLLTPLPMSKAPSSKPPAPHKPVLEEMTCNNNDKPSFLIRTFQDAEDDKFEDLGEKPNPSKLEDSSVASPTRKDSSMVVMTPCLKMSPPKSCVLLEPVSEPSHKGYYRFRKCTPYPVGLKLCRDTEISEPDESGTSEHLALKFPELLGIQTALMRRKEVEESPDWAMSPPKTCVLLELSDEKSLDNIDSMTHPSKTATSIIPNQQINPSISSENCSKDGHQTENSSIFQETVYSSLPVVESTPMRKEKHSVMRTGKRPGENTLKKELWTKFEEATMNPFRFNKVIPEDNDRNDFMDLLDEVS